MISTKPYKNFLADYRVKAGLSQSRLAELIGKTPTAISRYETGDRAMDKDVIITVAHILDIQPVDLFVNPNGTAEE